VVALAQVHQAFSSWLAFPDDDALQPRFDMVDIALAVVIANRMKTDPLWMFLVAPPSSGKTETINSLRDVPDVYPLSSLTPATFASGFDKKGVETSLLPKIDGRVLTMKDFGTVLTVYHEKRAEILAQLREIYDGSFEKEWGNGKNLKWSGRVGLLAGVTGVIDREYALGAILGERFLMYRVKGAPPRAQARRAFLQQSSWEQEQRQTLRRTVAAYLDTLMPLAPPMSDSMGEGILALAEFTAKARSPVFFDRRNGDIDLIPEPEAPGRLTKQLSLLARALAVVRQETTVSLATYSTVCQVANDSLPATRQVILQALLSREDPENTTKIAETTKYPTSSTRRFLQELTAVGPVNRVTSETAGKADLWRPSDELLALKLDIMKPHVEADDLTNKVRIGIASE
jgi:hypothetical protein